MAMTDTDKQPALTDRRCRLIAGLASLAVGIVGAAGLIVHLLALPAQPGGDVSLQLLWVALGVLVAACGYLLLRGRKAAMWILLAYWLLVTLGAVLQAFGWLLYDAPPLVPGFLAGLAWLFVPGKAVLGGAMSALLIGGTPPATRQRYAAVVAVSLAVTLAVVIVANMVAFWAPVEKDVETFGRFGLSQRTSRILADVHQPMRISAVYPAATGEMDNPDEQATARKRLDRVMEFLDEVHRENPKVEVLNASSDAARSRLIATLSQRQAEQTAPQAQLLAEALAATPKIVQALNNQRQRWADAPAESYLQQWRLQGGMQDVLTRWADGLNKQHNKVRQEQQTNPLPDNVQLLKDVTSTLEEFKTSLTTLRSQLETLGELPSAVAENASAFSETLDQAVESVRACQANLQSPAPDTTPAEQLKAFAETLGQASTHLRQTTEKLQTLAGSGEQAMSLLLMAEAWIMPRQTAQGTVGVHMPRQLLAIARELENLRAQIPVIIADANEDAQQRFLDNLGEPVGHLLNEVDTYAKGIRSGVQALQQVDDFSKDVFKQVREGSLFGTILSLVDPLLDKAKDLQAPTEDPLPEGLNEANILVLQTAGQVQVISFEETWPVTMESDNPYPAGKDAPRYFNGDAALGSRLLALTQPRPFARVLLTYYKPQGDPRRSMPQSEGMIPVSQLQTVREQLEQANFTVRNWNLTDEMPGPTGGTGTQPADGLPTVLLVLPPASSPIPPGMGGPKQRFAPEQIDRLRRAIDDGASAIFLASYLQPQRMGFGMPIPQQYPLNAYLEEDWGVRARTNYLIVAGQPTDQPGTYRLLVDRISYFPLSSFTDHPVGKPLQGQRLFWPMMCPVSHDAGALPAGVSVSPLLTLPETSTNVWASRNPEALFENVRMRGNEVSPDYAGGDLKVPLTVALAASRNPVQDAQPAPARIVVMGMAIGLMDEYVNSSILGLTEGTVQTYDPPRANPDLIVNSVYWLIGKERFIASGPARIEPVRDMSRATRATLWIVCVIVLPVAVLGAGGIVMLLRSRS
jgi:hypothetical protein